jgi:opacity protein-like surface antigen
MSLQSKKILFGTILGISFFSQFATTSAAELGSFLIRLEGSYNASTSKLASSVDKVTTYNSTIRNSKLNGYGAGIGFGYVASEEIWTDITLSFNNYKTKLDTTKTNIQKVRNSNITGMLNGYYGFNMNNKISPYVMIGFGPTITQSKITPPDTGMVINSNAALTDVKGEIKSKHTTYIAYQTGLGVSFKVMEPITLDIGYRIGNDHIGKYTIPSTGVGTAGKLILKPKSTFKHSLLFGVNIAF